MGQLEPVFEYTKEIESLLEDRLGATGRGLHEKASSVEENLPSEIFKKLRFIATIRNKIAHESGYYIEDFQGFATRCEESLTYLRSLETAGSAPPSKSNPEGWNLDVLHTRFRILLAIILAIVFGFSFRDFGGVGGAILGMIIGYAFGYFIASKTVLSLLFCLFIIMAIAGTVISLWGVGKPKSDPIPHQRAAPSKSGSRH